MSTQKQTEHLTLEEVFVIKNQDGLHKESIAMAKTKIEVRLSSLEGMSEKQMRRQREFQYLFDKGFLVDKVKAVAASAYKKVLNLIDGEDENTKVDYVLSKKKVDIETIGESEGCIEEARTISVESFGEIYNQTLYKTHTVEQAASMLVDCIDYSVVELNGRYIVSFVYSDERQFKVKTFPNLERTLMNKPKDTYMYGSITQDKLTASSWEDAVEELRERGVRYPIALTEFKRLSPFHEEYCEKILSEILKDLDTENKNYGGKTTPKTPRMIKATKNLIDVLKEEYKSCQLKPTGVKRVYVSSTEYWESGVNLEDEALDRDGADVENNNNAKE